jgi:thymidylate synthase
MRVISAVDVNDAYVSACKMLTYNPDFEASPRGLKIKECKDVIISLARPYYRIVSLPERALSLRYLAGEFAFYLRGSDKLENILPYSNSWAHLTDDGKTVRSCYGKRIFYDKENGRTPFSYALEQLMLDNDSRKAVITIYAPTDNLVAAKDNPCTMFLQFFIRNNSLHCTAHMRSNDVWFGFPYDVAFFTFVQERMLVALNTVRAYEDPHNLIRMGTYTHIAGSFHVYEKNMEKVKLIADTYEGAHFPKDAGELPRFTDKSECETGAFLRYEEALRLHNGVSLAPDMPAVEEAREALEDPFYVKLAELLEGK